MHRSNLVVSLLAAGSLFGLSVGLSSCGDEDSSSFPDADAMGGFSLSCGEGQQQQQQKDVPFEKQEGCVNQNPAQQQDVKFRDFKFADFDVQLDCDSREVIVSHKGIDPQTQTLPIRNDGTIEGTLVFHERLDEDGKGNQNCFVKFLVSFSGETVCDGEQKLELTTQLDFESTSVQELELAGIPMDPEATPSQSSSPSPSPSSDNDGGEMGGEEGESGPSPRPSPRPSPTARPAPTPTVEASQICKVENPCPFEGKTELSCPEE